MLKLLRISFILLLTASFCCKGQQHNTLAGADTLRSSGKKYTPAGIRLGYDLIALFRNNFTDNFSGYEINADVDFNRYYLAVDYGNWGRNFVTQDHAYSSDGNYFRVGADVNFLKKDPEKNMFFLGMRYVRSVFSEYLSTQVSDSVWGFPRQEYTNTNVKGRWFELTGGIRVKVWKIIWMGYTARFKFALKTSDSPFMIPHDVPGYGRTDKTSYWGFNYQLFIRLPFRKDR